MNFLKSLFISITPIWLLFVLYQGIRYFAIDELLSLAVIFSALPLLLFLSYILLFRKLARTSKHLLVLLIPSFMGYVIVLIQKFIVDDFVNLNAIIYSLSAFLLTFLYVYWYSDNKRSCSELIKNSNKLPKFPIINDMGELCSSADFIGNKTLIFFHRGNWCPICMAQIDEVVQSYKKFYDLGVDLIFIAPQSSKNTQALTKKYNLPMHFYVDEGNKAAKILEIKHKFGLPMGFQALGYSSNSVYPTVIATDEDGVIIYNDQTSNYRLRPEPDVLLAIYK